MRLPSIFSCVAILLGMFVPSFAGPPAPRDLQINTFSVVAHDPKTGDLGVAVASRYLASGAVVPWARAGVGAVATQAMARISFGPRALTFLEQGTAPEAALTQLLQEDARQAVRQIAVIDAAGRVAVHTGDECQEWAGHRAGEHYSVQGNILTGAHVLDEMAKAFEAARATSHSELADWLVAALRAGERAGGDRRGKQSAALLVVRENGGPGGDNDRYVDLRVDDHPDPVLELARLLGLHNQFHPHLHAPKRGPAAPNAEK